MKAITLLLAALVASPALATPCPTDFGQLRWDNVDQGLEVNPVQVTGSIWDRDRDGKPSAGDVMRIDEAHRGAQGLPIASTWITIDGPLAESLASSVETAPWVTAQCETPIEAEALPRVTTPAEIAHHLRRGLAPRARIALVDIDPQR